LPNCNYRRDLALSLGAVGRRITGDRPLTCAPTCHPDVRPPCTVWLNHARPRTANPRTANPKTQIPKLGFRDLAERWAVPPQPVASGAVVRTCVGHQPPVRRRMVHPAQVHQLVDQDVIAHRRRHQDQSPVQANVAVTSAGAPPRSLIADADAPDRKPMACRQFEQARRQLPPRLLSQGLIVLNRTKFGTRTCSLSDYPVNISLHERLGLTT
jgi:hypothetical protein